VRVTFDRNRKFYAICADSLREKVVRRVLYMEKSNTVCI